MEIPITILADKESEKQEDIEIWDEEPKEDTDNWVEDIEEPVSNQEVGTDTIEDNFNQLESEFVSTGQINPHDFKQFKSYILDNIDQTALINFSYEAYRNYFIQWVENQNAESDLSTTDKLKNKYEEYKQKIKDWWSPSKQDEASFPEIRFTEKGNLLYEGVNYQAEARVKNNYDKPSDYWDKKYPDIFKTSEYAALMFEPNFSGPFNIVYEYGIEPQRIVDITTTLLHTLECIPLNDEKLFSGQYIIHNTEIPKAEYPDMDVAATYETTIGTIHFWKVNDVQPRYLVHELGHKKAEQIFGNWDIEVSKEPIASTFLTALSIDGDVSWYGKKDKPDEAFAEAYLKWIQIGKVTNDKNQLLKNITGWFKDNILPSNMIGKKGIKMRIAKDEDWHIDFENNPDNYEVRKSVSPDNKEAWVTIIRKSDSRLMSETFGTPKSNKVVPITKL